MSLHPLNADSGTLSARVHQMLTSEDDGRVCRDIPDSACHEQPRNFLVHVFSLSATKTGDGLADPKLVLSWLLSSVGAPAFLIGLLVPIREAGALLPQLFTAATIRNLPQRKWVWAAGSLIQGLAVLGIGIAMLVLSGAAAGWMAVALLTIFALARSVCSVSYKDVLGKTVSKATRGTATGTAGTVSALLVLSFGVLLASGLLEKSVPVIVGGLFVAAGLWIFSAVLFSTLAEEAGATAGGGNPIGVVIEQLSLLHEDPQLLRFIVVRGLLTATALAPPYIVAMSGSSGEAGLGSLGAFVVASALASVVSSYAWGRLSDKSSRRVLALSAAIAAIVFAIMAIAPFFEESMGWQSSFMLPVVLFVLMLAYQGVRLGRATHIVDMADATKRGAYTAISNTAVGILLVIGGLFGFVAEHFGLGLVFAVFALMSIAALVLSLGLREVQGSDSDTGTSP